MDPGLRDITLCVKTATGLKSLNGAPLARFALSNLRHGIDGRPGSCGTTGYDRGAIALVASIVAAAHQMGWHVDVRTITRLLATGHTGSDGVSFSGTVYGVTVGYAAATPTNAMRHESYICRSLVLFRHTPNNGVERSRSGQSAHL